MNEVLAERSGGSVRPGEQDPNRRRIIVLTAPSGGGKTTIARQVMSAIPDLRFSVSATTRPARSREQDGVDYYFVSPERFQQYIDAGELLEYEEVYPGLFYGTLHEEIERKSVDSPILLDVDVRGANAVKQQFGDDALVIFIRPPTFEILEARLRSRATENPATLRTRLERARKELEYADRFDAVVINEEVETAVSETLALIRQFLKR